MARASMRRFDVQAVYSVLLSLAAWVPLLALMFLLFVRNFRWDEGAIIYNGKNPVFMILVLALTGVVILLSVTGLSLGFNSAGRRRNDKSTYSWMGFFFGTGAFMLGLISFIAFVMLRMAI